MTQLNGRDAELVEAIVRAVDARFESRFAGMHEAFVGLRERFVLLGDGFVGVRQEFADARHAFADVGMNSSGCARGRRPTARASMSASTAWRHG